MAEQRDGNSGVVPARCGRASRASHRGDQHILTLNAGSSSLKAGLHRMDRDAALVLAVDMDRIGSDNERLRVRDGRGAVLAEREGDLPDYQAALAALFGALAEHASTEHLSAVGHRIVHGGPHYSQPRWVTPELVSALRDLAPLDPTHMPQALAGIEYVSENFPDLKQAACFDTTFHQRMPKVARMIPLPRRLQGEDLERFGFHGLSYEYIMGELRALEPAAATGRVIVAHLGNGASMAAILDGQSVDTTMGFTPTSGLVMGGRCGDIDPGVLIYLLEQKKMAPREVDAMLNEHSGLLGISGTSSDMRDLLAVEASDSHAADAIALFCYRAKKYLGALASALGGLDALVFTGGMGEKSSVIRERICAGQGFLGIELDRAANDANAPLISSRDSAVSVRVIATNEERMIARHTIALLGDRQVKAVGADACGGL